jgi:hypothetical protein
MDVLHAHIQQGSLEYWFPRDVFLSGSKKTICAISPEEIDHSVQCCCISVIVQDIQHLMNALYFGIRRHAFRSQWPQKMMSILVCSIYQQPYALESSSSELSPVLGATEGELLRHISPLTTTALCTEDGMSKV